MRGSVPASPGRKCVITILLRGLLNSLVLPSEQNGFKPPVRSIILRRKFSISAVSIPQPGSAAIRARSASARQSTLAQGLAQTPIPVLSKQSTSDDDAGGDQVSLDGVARGFFAIQLEGEELTACGAAAGVQSCEEALGRFAGERWC